MRRPPQRLIVAADVAAFGVAFGIVPLVLALLAPPDPARGGRAPWSFALEASWSPSQVIAIVLTGAVLGWLAGGRTQGWAAVALGIVLGVAVDLWWFGTWADRGFVSILPQDEWRLRMVASTLTLIGAAGASFFVAAAARRVVGGQRVVTDLTAAQVLGTALATGVAALLGAAVAFAAANSPLVVPADEQIQTIRVHAAAIKVDPVVLQPGGARFRCEVDERLEEPDGTARWVYLVPGEVPEDGLAPSPDGAMGGCDAEQGGTAWATIEALEPGRYTWVLADIDLETGSSAVRSTVEMVVVGP